MINYLLIALGSIFAIIGIILFIKKFGDSASKVKFLGAELETGSSSLVIFIVGAALIALGATVKTKEQEKYVDPANTAAVKEKGTDSLKGRTDTSAAGKDTSDTDNSTNNTPDHPAERQQPLYEFTLAAGEQHVMNDLQITLTLPSQVPSVVTTTHEKTVKIRIWRNITNPLSDTAVLDHSSSGNGVEMQLFVLSAITPISITDVGQYKFFVYNAVMIGRRIASVQVKIYKG